LTKITHQESCASKNCTEGSNKIFQSLLSKKNLVLHVHCFFAEMAREKTKQGQKNDLFRQAVLDQFTIVSQPSREEALKAIKVWSPSCVTIRTIHFQFQRL
jgi:hypothetical protein